MKVLDSEVLVFCPKEDDRVDVDGFCQYCNYYQGLDSDANVECCWDEVD